MKNKFCRSDIYQNQSFWCLNPKPAKIQQNQFLHITKIVLEIFTLSTHLKALNYILKPRVRYRDRFLCCEFEHTFQLNFFSFSFNISTEIRSTMFFTWKLCVIFFCGKLFFCTNKLWCKFRMEKKKCKFALNNRSWRLCSTERCLKDRRMNEWIL